MLSLFNVSIYYNELMIENQFCSDILAPTQIAIKIREFLLGTPQFLMNVVFIVMEQFSNLIHLLTLSIWRMIVRLLNHHIVEFYQVSIFPLHL